MGEFEFLRFITIGQYLPTGSVIHRLDPRARLLGGLLLLAAITAASRWTGLALALVVLYGLLRLARISPGYALQGLLAPLPFILFLALLQLLFGPEAGSSPVLIAVGPVRISTADLLHALILILRFAGLVLGISLLSFCIATTELVHSLEALLRPLTALGLPTHDLFLMIQGSLRFLPLAAQEAERIAKAQASRGADWGTGRGGLLRRVRQVLPILVPLFLTSLHRAENLALAMEARGYAGSKGRTSMVRLHFHPQDAWALILVIALALAIVLL